MTTIVIDTNLWVAALIGSSMRARIEQIIADGTVIILADAELFKELEAVCLRPKITRMVTPELAVTFLQILKERFTHIEPVHKVQICRDPNDDFLLSICHDGDADFLLTGDKDLLSMENFGKTKIISLSDYESLGHPKASQ